MRSNDFFFLSLFLLVSRAKNLVFFTFGGYHIVLVIVANVHQQGRGGPIRDMKEETPNFRLFAATFTPLKGDGTLNLASIPHLINYLINRRISGLFVCGTTGEWSSLSLEERMACGEAFIEAAQGRLRTIVHVGDNSIRQARKLAIHAVEAGADGVAAVAPFFYDGVDASTLVDCCRGISESVPETPFYYYHIPELTKLKHPMSDFMVRAADQIPNFAGIKFSDIDLKEFQACIELAGESFDVFYGVDEMLLSSLVVGARAAVGSTYNFAAPAYQELLKKFETGDLAGAASLQLKIVHLVKICGEFGKLSAFKAIMEFLGVDCGPLRLPLLTLDEETKEQLRDELNLIGFFDWATVSG